MAIQTLHNAVKMIRNVNREIRINPSRNTRCTAGRGYKKNGIDACRANAACAEYGRARAGLAYAFSQKTK